MRLRISLFLLSLPAALAISACGGDDPVGETLSLTPVQAEYLARGLVIQSYGALTSNSLGSPSSSLPEDLAAVARPFDREVSVTAPCDPSGSVEIDLDLAGTVDDETLAMDLTLALVQDHRNCAMEAEDGSVSLVLNGAPDLTTLLALSFDGVETIELSGSVTGGLEVLDALTGEGTLGCPVSLTFSGGASPQGPASFSLEGTVCGVAVSQTVSATS